MKRLLPKLTRVELTQRQPIYAPDAPIHNVYFIEVGMVSLVANLANGMQAEVGLVGREEMTGIWVISYVTRSGLLKKAGGLPRLSHKGCSFGNARTVPKIRLN